MTATAAAGAVVLALGLAACGGGGGGGGGDQGAETGFDAAVKGIVNKQDQPTGGELKIAMSDDIESTDPGDTYYAYNWDFTRNWARTMLAFKNEPGEAGNELTPDIAEGMGQPSEGGKVWTYKIKQGLKFEDGTPITAKDIKYAIARSNFSEELQKGPKYFLQYLDAGDYKGPYKDKNLDNFKGVETPDDHTLVFKLKEPFGEFDYLMTMPQTAPVPADKDKGLDYTKHPVSSGPYEFQGDYVPGKGFTLVKNENWDPASDPLRKQMTDKITFQPGQDAQDIDNRLKAGDLHIDLAGTGVQAAMKTQILADPNVKKQADNPTTSFLRFFDISTKVKPFDNKACREAVQYAADKVAIQTAWGGPSGGEIATNAMPTKLPGYKRIDPYATPGHKGDVAKAKAKLAECGQPNGFKTNISTRSDRPKEVQAATALQQALAKVGIQAEIKDYPSSTYTNEQAGSPSFVKKEELGIMLYGWGPDWPSGFGFFSQISDGRAIKPSGNSNLAELDDPRINEALDKAASSTDKAEREKLYQQIDQYVMESATLLPFVNEKTLLYRPESLTNVFVHEGYHMYNFTNLGVKQP